MGKAQSILGGVTLATKLPLISVILYLLLSTLVFFAGDVKAQELSEKDKKELIYLLTQDCGSCHGLTLQGGLGPALLKKNLKGKPAEYLSAVIKYGRQGTPMPPWQNILSDEEIKFLAEYLISDTNKLSTYQTFISQSDEGNPQTEKTDKKSDESNSDSPYSNNTSNILKLDF